MVNEYFDGSSKGSIEEAVTPEHLQATPTSVIANSLHFHGLWSFAFENKTEDRRFWVTDNEVIRVPTMFVQDHFLTGRDRAHGVTFVALPIGGDKELSMFLAVPDRPGGLRDVEANLSDLLLVTMSPKHTKLYLPLFSLSYRTGLKDVLQEAGLELTFNKRGEFNNMYQSVKGPLLNDVSSSLPFIQILIDNIIPLLCGSS